MNPNRNKIQVTFTNQHYALVQTAADASGESYATTVRRAVTSYYADLAKTAAYQANLEHLNITHPEEQR